MLEKVAKKIRQVREEKGISQKKLGMTLGLSDKAISAYEKGRTYPPIDTLAKIADELGKPIAYFLNDDSEEQDLFDRVSKVEDLLTEVASELAIVKTLAEEKRGYDSATPPSEPVEDGVHIVPNGATE